MAADDKTPVLRVAVGNDPNAMREGGAPDFAFIQLGFQAVHAGAASSDAGRPVYDKALFITHVYPGSTDQLDVEVKRYPAGGGEAIIMDEVRAARFAEIIAKFEQNAQGMETGTPLSVLNFDPAQVKNMEAAGAGTVEMLAAVPDGTLGRLGMGARGLRQRAIAYLDALGGGEAMARLQAQFDGQAAETDELRRQLADLLAERNAALAASPTPPAKPAASSKGA